MLLPIPERVGLKFGDPVYRYFPKIQGMPYDLGNVEKIAEGYVEVDFGDTCLRFCISEISYGINMHNGFEHYMTCSDGVLVGRYPHDPNIIEAARDEALDDMLEFMLSHI